MKTTRVLYQRQDKKKGIPIYLRFPEDGQY